MSEHHRTKEWAKVLRDIRPMIAAQVRSGAVCVNCGRPILPEHRWQVGHITDAAVARAQGWSVAQINAPSNLGPSHTKSAGQRACNQIAGGKLGAKVAKANRDAKRDGEDWPKW